MLRQSLPLILRASALALAAVAVILGLLGYDNPLQLVVLIVGGVAFASAIAALAGILEAATHVASALGTIQADQRQQTRALLSLMEEDGPAASAGE